MKSALLSHTLTPLEFSLQHQLNLSNSSNQYKACNTRDDNSTIASSDDSIEPNKLTDACQVEGKSVQEPARKKQKITENVDKNELLNPRALLDDMLPSFDSQSFNFNHTNNTQITDRLSDKDQNTEHSGSILSLASNEKSGIDTRYPILENSVLEECSNFQEDTSIFRDKSSENKWECSHCQFPNPTILQTCGICHSYRNTKLTKATVFDREIHKENSKKELKSDCDYELTVANENNMRENMTVPEVKIKIQTETKIHKEAHILYTGLTPEDDKKLEKVKDEVAKSGLKIIIHYQTRNFDEITHIITSANNKRLCRRTLKYLQGILEGKWIVDPEWLIKSIKLKEWQPENIFEIQGDQTSGVTRAPCNGRKNQGEQLFADMKFYFFGEFSGKHNKNDLLILCRMGGAKILSRKPNGYGSRVDEKHDPLLRTEPVVIMSKESKKKPTWLSECQVRDPSWIIECISKLTVE